MYRAVNEKLNRPVAIKVLLAGADDRARRQFARELAIVVRLGSHPHIVQVFDAGLTDDGRPYVAMELYDQGSLSDRLTRGGTLSVEEALDIGVKICSAVQAAHDAGILHRDIKPQNILMSDYGPALADFGVARAAGNLDASQTLNSLTPWHAAPECFADDSVTAASDVYSLGSTLFTLLAGRPPFAGAPDEPVIRYEARLARTPVPHIPRPDMPPELQAILERALAKRPEDRYGSAAALGEALKGLQLRGPASLAPAPPEAASPWSPGGGGNGGMTLRRGELPPGVPAVTPPATGLPPVAPPGPAGPADPMGQTGIGGMGSRETIVRPGTVPRMAAPPPPPAPRSRRRGLLAAAGAGLVVVVVAAVSLVVVLGGRHATLPTPPPPAPAGPPTGFVAVDHGATVDLSWTDHSQGRATYFVVYRSVDGPQQLPVSIDQGKTAYEVTQLDPTKGYCFRLGAVLPEGSGLTTVVLDASVRGCIAASPGTSPSP